MPNPSQRPAISNNQGKSTYKPTALERSGQARRIPTAREDPRGGASVKPIHRRTAMPPKPPARSPECRIRGHTGWRSRGQPRKAQNDTTTSSRRTRTRAVRLPTRRRKARVSRRPGVCVPTRDGQETPCSANEWPDPRISRRLGESPKLQPDLWKAAPTRKLQQSRCAVVRVEQPTRHRTRICPTRARAISLRSLVNQFPVPISGIASPLLDVP